jgi:hypothetical protein
VRADFNLLFEGGKIPFDGLVKVDDLAVGVVYDFDL